MSYVLLYVVTALVFLGLDAVMLKKVMRPLFDRHLGDWLLADIRLGAAALFYLAYVAGVVVLAGAPALKAGVPAQAFVHGALIGAMAYGTYEFTNYATLRLWSPQMVAVDLIWGIVLTALSAGVAVLVVRALVQQG